jgi:hypothetical protein
VQSRLATLDDSLEEAAMDLGARPGKVFFVITLPIIAPALISGWLLSFTISLDDLVITSFVSGPTPGGAGTTCRREDAAQDLAGGPACLAAVPTLDSGRSQLAARGGHVLRARSRNRRCSLGGNRWANRPRSP